MRKIWMGLGLAAAFAGVAGAQQPGIEQGRGRGVGGEHREVRRGGRMGGPRGLLLKDITLSEAQKAQLQELRKSGQQAFRSNRETMKERMEEARTARQRGDTAAVRAIMERNRQEMARAREHNVAAVRNILTPDQRVQFDKNVAALTARVGNRTARAGRAANDGGARGDRARRMRGGGRKG